MHVNAFDTPVTFPAKVTYLRPGPARDGRGVKNRDAEGRSSSPDTGRRELGSPNTFSLLLGNSLPKGVISTCQQATVGQTTERRKALPKAA